MPNKPACGNYKMNPENDIVIPYRSYNLKQKGWSIAAHLFLCVAALFLTRWGFYISNRDFFGHPELLRLSWYGLRFDLSAICMTTGLMFFLLLLPFKWNYKTSRYWSLAFTVIFALVLCFELADWKYFPYNQRRSNADVLQMISRGGDFLSLLPGFFRDFWYLFLLAGAMTWGIYMLSRRIFRLSDRLLLNSNAPGSRRVLWQHSAAALAAAGLMVIGVRGGLQLVPITPRNAILYTTNQQVPLVLNTTFNIITSLQSREMEHVHYTDDAEARNYVQPIHYPDKGRDFIPRNVMVIILESFSKEFTGLTAGKSYTPFLDSLMQISYTFTNAYANSFQSAQGIPAILAGIPGLTDHSFITSAYANNNINSFASLLKPYGYTSVFFHNATNGSMNFDLFAKNAGYDRYFGRREYNNEKDYDGSWGIWDEPFMQRVADEIAQLPQPFHASMFNINSHQPYIIPARYRDRFKEEGLPIYSAVRYSDYAVQQFFRKAAEQPWFSNTLFIFTADHASPIGSNDFYMYKTGKFRIPIFIYDPSQQAFPATRNSHLMQQIDILPTVMTALGYPEPYYALGRDARGGNGMILAKAGADTYFISDSLQLTYFNEQLTGVYRFPADSMNTTNLQADLSYREAISVLQRHFHYYKQVYVNDMIDNRMYYRAAR